MFFKKKKKKEAVEVKEVIRTVEDDKPKRDIYFELTGKRKEEVKPNDKA